MSFTDILAELPRLAQHERREIADRALALDDDAQIIEERRHLADEAFRMLDALEDDKAANFQNLKAALVQLLYLVPEP